MRVYDANRPFLRELARAARQDADETCIRLANSVHMQYVEASVIIASLQSNI